MHTHPQTQAGLDVQWVLGEEGVGCSRVVLGHSGDTTDADHLAALANAGFYPRMDRFGIDPELPFEQRVDVVVRMCERGYAS